nr:unnamed protein product [Callosobruchus chinensis]
MIEKCRRWIKLPSNPADVTEAKRRWQRKYTCPCAVSVIDCTHIKVKRPPLHGDEYINRKQHQCLGHLQCRRVVYKRSRIMARICP